MLIPFDELFKRHNVSTPPGILHLGANTGQELPMYQKLGIDQVIWVEAIPSVYLQLCRNVLKHEGQTAILACLSDKDGDVVKFNIASNEGQSSSMLEFGTHSAEHPTVKFVGEKKFTTTRVDTVFKDWGIDFQSLGFQKGWLLNIDLQGAELMALKGMGDLIQHFDHAYIEVNTRELYKGCPLVGEIDSYLEAFGFKPKECKMTGAGWGDKFYSKL